MTVRLRSSAYPWTFVESLIAGARSRAMFADVQKYVMFIGQPRSGTSLIGSLLNAHRNMWVAQELNALNYLRRGYGRNQLCWLLYMRDRDFNKRGRQWTGYDYEVAGQWQGRYEKLTVIGDKKAGLSSEQFGRQPELLTRLQDIVQVPIRMLHVIRNPFNVITTIHRKRRNTSLEQAADMFFGRTRTNWGLMQDHPEMILTMHLEQLIASPEKHLKQMCGFLDVPADEDYISACSELLFEKPRQSQTDVKWSKSMVDSVTDRIQEFPFLAGYDFLEAPSSNQAAA